MHGGIQGFMVTCETEQGPIFMESERVSGRFMWCSPKSLQATFSFLFCSYCFIFQLGQDSWSGHVRLLDWLSYRYGRSTEIIKEGGESRVEKADGSDAYLDRRKYRYSSKDSRGQDARWLDVGKCSIHAWKVGKAMAWADGFTRGASMMVGGFLTNMLR